MSFKSRDVLLTPALFEIIRDFYGRNSYFYLGILCRDTKNIIWRTKKWTSKHLVTESRRRISRLVHDPLTPKGNTLLTECMRSAARLGYIRGVNRVKLYSERKRLRLSTFRQVNVMDAAARSGSIEMLEYMEGFAPIGKSTLMEACRSNNSVEVIEWLLARKCEVDDNVEAYAARIGNAAALQALSLRDFFPGFSKKVMILAGASGSTIMVDFLAANGCRFNTTPDVLCMAAFYGHLDLVKHLKLNLNCPWDLRACWMAAIKGHLKVIDWMRTQNPPCPWNYLTRNTAFTRRHFDIVQYYDKNT